MDDEIDRTERLLRLSVPLGSIVCIALSLESRFDRLAIVMPVNISVRSPARYVTQRVSVLCVRRIGHRFRTNYLVASR